jgi:hypothetical protein
MFAAVFGAEDDGSIRYSSYDRTDKFGNQYAVEKPVSSDGSPGGDDNPFGEDPVNPGDGNGDSTDPGSGGSGGGSGGGDDSDDGDGPGVRPGVPF